MMETIIKVEGMSCQHCVMRVKKALEGLNGVIDSDVQIGLVKVIFDESKVQINAIEKAITDAGYSVIH